MARAGQLKFLAEDLQVGRNRSRLAIRLPSEGATVLLRAMLVRSYPNPIDSIDPFGRKFFSL